MNNNALQLAPYLNFNGNCEEAMQFYQSIFGGNLELHRFAEYGMTEPAESKDKIMHAMLTAGPILFMAADRPAGMQVATFGDNIHMSISGGNEADLTRYFNGLAEGGTTTMPLAKQIWGDVFGSCTDKFGVHWMVNISQPKA